MVKLDDERAMSPVTWFAQKTMQFLKSPVGANLFGTPLDRGGIIKNQATINRQVNSLTKNLASCVFQGYWLQIA